MNEDRRHGSPKTVVYVSSADTREVIVLHLQRASGAVELVDRTLVPGIDGPSPTSMPLAVSPDRRFLYAALRSPPYPVATYAIDPLSGRLTALASAPLVDAMAYLATDRTGRYLLSASYVGAKVTVNRIGPRGEVRAPAVQVIATPPRAHSVLMDARNRFAFAASLGGDMILQYRFDAETGAMTPNLPAVVRAKPGAGPRHQALHPNNRFVYVLNELDATIASYRLDPQSGTLAEHQIIGLLPAGLCGDPSAADLHITADGRFLYGSERASSSITGFRVDEETGLLSQIESVPTEPSPRGFNIDPSGRFLIAVGQISNRMAVYAIDGQSGRLTKTEARALGSNPNWVEIVDLPGPR